MLTDSKESTSISYTLCLPGMNMHRITDLHFILACVQVSRPRESNKCKKEWMCWILLQFYNIFHLLFKKHLKSINSEAFFIEISGMHESAQLFWSQDQFRSGNWFARSVSKPELYAWSNASGQIFITRVEWNVLFFPSSTADTQSSEKTEGYFKQPLAEWRVAGNQHAGRGNLKMSRRWQELNCILIFSLA